MKHHYYFCKKLGFTLAETLITLGIIGIVAALTMPALLSNYRKHLTETRLKHFYSEINQAIKHAEIDYGNTSEWEFGLFTPTSTYIEYKEWLNKYILPYIKHLKVDNCHGPFACIYFTNGSMLIFGYDNVIFYPIATTNIPTAVMGKDKFAFGFAPNSPHNPLAKNKGIEPYLGSLYNNDLTTLYNSDDYGCNSTTSIQKNNLNRYCTRIIQMNGWKIPNNYPIKF